MLKCKVVVFFLPQCQTNVFQLNLVLRYLSCSCSFPIQETQMFLCTTSSTCSQGIMVHQTKPVKVASRLPSRTSTPLLWRTSKSQISSMKTQSTTLHWKPPALMQQCLLLLCCQVRFDWKSLFFFWHSCLPKTSHVGTAAAALCAQPRRNLSS